MGDRLYSANKILILYEKAADYNLEMDSRKMNNVAAVLEKQQEIQIHTDKKMEKGNKGSVEKGQIETCC